MLVKRGGENNKNNFAAHKVFLIFFGGGKGGYVKTIGPFQLS